MKVPEYNDGVAAEPLQGLPDARQRISTAGDDFLSPNAAAVVGGLDQGLDKLNRAAAEIYSAQLQEANQTRALDAVNHFEQIRQDRLFGQNGAFNLRGAEVFNQGNSVPLADNVKNDLQQSFTDIADSLGNDEQRHLFAAHALPAIQQSYGQTLQHEAEQYRVYRRGVNQAAIATHQQAMALNYNNPALLKESVAAIRGANVDLARLEGYPEQAGMVQAEQHVSGALSGAFAAALQQHDHAGATRILKDFAPDMDTGTMLKLFGTLQEADSAGAAYRIGNQVMAAFLPKMQTSDQDRAWNLALVAESAGRHFAEDGSVLSSPAGAKGAAQLLPETAAATAKAHGLPWRPELFNRRQTGDVHLDAEAADYNQRLGRLYFDQQLRSFKGDLSLAYAAYNAGPTAVRAALDHSVKSGGHWLAELPKETQDYVNQNMNAFAAGGGAFQRPTLAEVTAAANAHLDAAYGAGASPQLRKQVLEQVSQGFEWQTQAIKQRDEQGLAEAYRQLLANGGGYASLPVAVRAAVPPGKVDNVIAFAGKLAKGQEPETDWGLYYRLMSNRLLLKNTNLLALRDQLADVEFKQLTRAQHSGGNPAIPTTAVRSAGDVLQSFMLQAGIDPAPKSQDKAGAAQLGKIWSVYEQRVADFEQLNGKKANTQDLEKIAGQLFTRVPVAGWLYGVNDKPAVLVDRARDKVVIPEQEQRRIVEALQAEQPGRVITDDDVWMVYMRHKGLM